MLGGRPPAGPAWSDDVVIGFPHSRGQLAEDVAQHIRGLIFDGTLKPGSRIRPVELAADLGLSRLPIRQALAQLEQEGLVDHLPNRGTFVSSLSREDVIDHFLAFGLISGLAAFHAAREATDEEAAHLHEINEALRANPIHSDQERLNWRFHTALNRASRSRRVQSILRHLAKTIPPGFYRETWSDQAYEEHVRIINAIASHDPEAAQAAVVEHLRSSGEHAVELLDEAGFWR
jgi:DNA-binding GntR family transcriptional regulator